MKYISTRGNAPVLSFEEAMLSGLARDGGLYVPQTIPQMSAKDIAALAGQPYEEIAFRVMKPFVGDCFSDAELMDAIAAAMRVLVMPHVRHWCNWGQTIICLSCFTVQHWPSKILPCS